MYGEKIATIRIGRGYSQDFMANALGMKQANYSKIETNKKVKIEEELLKKIADILGVGVEDIKSPTPIIMHFSNSPYIGQTPNNHILVDANLIKQLTEQLKVKDEQISGLHKVIASLIKG
jgi:transcriptional regulator with XRE-family HTH domain